MDDNEMDLDFMFANNEENNDDDVDLLGLGVKIFIINPLYLQTE